MLFSFSVAGLALGVLMAGIGAILNVTSKRNDDFEHDTLSSVSEDRPAAGPGSRTVEGPTDPATIRRSKAEMAMMGAAIARWFSWRCAGSRADVGDNRATVQRLPAVLSGAATQGWPETRRLVGLPSSRQWPLDR